MPLMNSMGAFKQQRLIAGTVPPPTGSDYYSATNFNSSVDDDNNFSTTVIDGFPYIYGDANGTNDYSFLCKLSPSTGAILKTVAYVGNSIRGVVKDSLNNYHVLMSTGTSDFNLIKFNSSWIYITSKSFSGFNINDAVQLFIDNSNNIYFISHFTDSNFIKIDSSYNVVFAKQIDSNTGFYPKTGIDSSGNMYCVHSDVDYIYVQKLDSSGSTISWQKSFYNPELPVGVSAFGACVDSSGNVYVCNGTGDATNRLFVSKLDTNGSVIFNKTITLNSIIGANYPGNIVINSGGNVLIQGIDLANNMFFIELSTSGTILNDSYITGANLPSPSELKYASAGTGKVYVPYIEEGGSFKMMVMLSLSNNGTFAGSPSSYSYTYQGTGFGGTLTDNSVTYSIATNSDPWTTTSYTLNTLTITTGTPTLTTSSVTPFNYSQSI